MPILPWALLIAAPSAPAAIAVGPVEGPEPTASALTEALVRTVGRLSETRVVDVRGIGAAFGSEALAAYRACAGDPCRVRAAARLDWQQLVVAETDGAVVRARLLERDPEAPARVRVSRDIGADPVLAADAVVRDLFPERAAASGGWVEVVGLPGGAAVRFGDDDPVFETAGRVRVRLAPGPHSIEARARGHAPWRSEVEARLGAPVRVEAGLAKRRSDGPLWLGAGGAAAVAGGVALALVAQARVDDWAEACAGAGCDPGFTLERYRSDADAQERERVAAGTLVAAGGAALVGAVVWYLLDPGQSRPGDVFAAPDGLGVRF